MNSKLDRIVDWVNRWFLVAFAAVIWILVGIAAVSMALGDPDAINGVIGGGISAVIVTVSAIVLWIGRR